MLVADADPNLVRAFGGLLGAVFGALGAGAADTLPRRYGIVHVASPARRKRRNLFVVGLALLVGIGVGNVVATMMPASALGAGVFLVVVNTLLAASVISAAAIDLEHMILPNELTLGGAVLALATAHWRSVGLAGAITGALVGLAVSYLPLVVYKKIRGQSGMGLGDAKLTVLAGAWQGVEGALFVLLAAAVQSTLTAVTMRVLRLRFEVPESVKAEIAELRARADAGDEEARAELADDPMAADEREGTLAMRLPLGPFLALACIELLLARRFIFARLFALLGGP